MIGQREKTEEGAGRHGNNQESGSQSDPAQARDRRFMGVMKLSKIIRAEAPHRATADPPDYKPTDRKPSDSAGEDFNEVNCHTLLTAFQPQALQRNTRTHFPCLHVGTPTLESS